MADAGRVAYSGVDVAASRDEMMRRIWFILAAFLAVGTVAACVSSKFQASKPQTQFGSQVGGAHAERGKVYSEA